MRSKNALPGFVLGMLAAIIVVGLGMAPALAHDGDPLALLTSRTLAPQAVASQGFGGSSPLVIPAADFSSDGADPGGFWFSFSGYIDGSGTACLKAPAYLPDGVTVTSVYASLYDNATGNVFVNLRRVNVTSGTSDVMADLGTVADSTTIQQRGDPTISYAEISYPDYAYYATTCLNSADHRLYAVQVYYEYDKVYLPLILKGF